MDVELIDWDIWDDEYYAEYKEMGLKWDLPIQQYASVHDKDGKYLRDCTYDDWEVCKANGIKRVISFLILLWVLELRQWFLKV